MCRQIILPAILFGSLRQVSGHGFITKPLGRNVYNQLNHDKDAKPGVGPAVNTASKCGSVGGCSGVALAMGSQMNLNNVAGAGGCWDHPNDCNTSTTAYQLAQKYPHSVCGDVSKERIQAMREGKLPGGENVPGDRSGSDFLDNGTYGWNVLVETWKQTNKWTYPGTDVADKTVHLNPNRDVDTATEGSEYQFEFDITAFHYGWFEFRLCDHKDDTPTSQDCFDKHVLQFDPDTIRKEFAEGKSCSEGECKMKQDCDMKHGTPWMCEAPMDPTDYLGLSAHNRCSGPGTSWCPVGMDDKANGPRCESKWGRENISVHSWQEVYDKQPTAIKPRECPAGSTSKNTTHDWYSGACNKWAHQDYQSGFRSHNRFHNGSCCEFDNFGTSGTCSKPEVNTNRWVVPDNGMKTNINYRATYKLPEGVTCGCSKEEGCDTEYPCTVQWLFVTGNNPDTFPEQFWNCGDLRILPKKKVSLDIGGGPTTPAPPTPSTLTQAALRGSISKP